VKFLVAGAGSWGTAFTHVLLERGHDVILGCHHAHDADAINKTGRNPRFLPKVDLRGATAVPLEAAPADVDVVVVAVPSRAFADVVAALPGDAPVLSLTKGLDPATGERLSTRVGERAVAVLSGPNMAEEIAIGMPTAAVIASEDGYLAGQLQHAINSTVFRAYVNPDIVGVELCAAAKNVIALAAGGVDGLDLGDNSKAALITRGLAEMARLGEAAGARAETFAGLAGMGDLIVTCWSRHGRNRKAGELIAQGRTADEAVAEIGQTVEGITTAPVLQSLSHRLGVELPITDGVCSVLSGRSLHELVSRLMGRQPTEE
jgi:glycerol-3-phosphate dehydrogenase (NAD(P)+)